jgi:hypothetical protein
MEGIPSARRDATAEENLERFEMMKNGGEEGVKWCLRAKISVDDGNKAMRDPVIYRCVEKEHHRTGFVLCCLFADTPPQRFLITNLISISKSIGPNGKFTQPTISHVQLSIQSKALHTLCVPTNIAIEILNINGCSTL